MLSAEASALSRPSDARHTRVDGRGDLISPHVWLVSSHVWLMSPHVWLMSPHVWPAPPPAEGRWVGGVAIPSRGAVGRSGGDTWAADGEQTAADDAMRVAVDEVVELTLARTPHVKSIKPTGSECLTAQYPGRL